MRLGIDLDNTIVCYGDLFYRLAGQSGLLSEDCCSDKQAVRNHLRATGREDDWIKLQGIVYGKAMDQANPFAGVKGFIYLALQHGWSLFIVSHRTRHPYLGPRFDLHRAARDWLCLQGIAGPSSLLSDSDVYLEETLTGKLQRISSLHCNAFIDDLPELLLHEDFPEDVQRLCFDPEARCDGGRIETISAWSDLGQKWFG
jgi:hypothetical protein